MLVDWPRFSLGSPGEVGRGSRDSLRSRFHPGCALLGIEMAVEGVRTTEARVERSGQIDVGRDRRDREAARCGVGVVVTPQVRHRCFGVYVEAPDLQLRS